MGRIEVPIIVNLLNGNIKPRVSYSCDHCTVEDEFIFDASESFEEGNPDSKLLYSCNIFDDDSWEVVQSEESQFAHGIPKEGLIPVKLRVHSADGLYLDTLFHVEVHEFNTAPYANLSIGCRVGNTHTQFYFHSRYSWDRDESMLNLHIQWDLNNDGEWDSEWDDQMDVYTQYSQTGQHFVRLGITDTGDKQSIVVDTIMVFEGNHETGLIKDNRPDLDQYYGTVKIGDQWWMQENLNSAFQVKNFRLEPKCYQNNPENCEKYGGLYQLWQVHYEEGLCPKGWKVPSTKDWEALMETLGEDPIAQLVWGGASEMHLQTAGYIDIRRGYLGMGTNTHFWTRDITPTGIPIAWFFAPKQQINQKVYVGSGYEFYVRCIKE